LRSLHPSTWHDSAIGTTTVTGLAVTAVKGTRLRVVDAIELGRTGARGDRRFFVIDDNDRMVNGKTLGSLQTLIASYDEQAEALTLDFPDGSRVTESVRQGAPVTARFYSQQVDGRVVVGPWAAALSAHVGQPLRLVSTGSGVDRGARGAASLISRASLARLAREAGVDAVDGRRFRMLIEIDGVSAHAEDDWVGARLRVGEALIRFEGHVGRCLITSRDPDSGEVDLPTLDLLRGYRGDAETTEPLPFGIYGRVLEPGAIRVGDRVARAER
jgi:uncharacterized protein YcbX